MSRVNRRADAATIAEATRLRREGVGIGAIGDALHICHRTVLAILTEHMPAENAVIGNQVRNNAHAAAVDRLRQKRRSPGLIVLRSPLFNLAYCTAWAPPLDELMLRLLGLLYE